MSVPVAIVPIVRRVTARCVLAPVAIVRTARRVVIVRPAIVPSAASAATSRSFRVLPVATAPTESAPLATVLSAIAALVRLSTGSSVTVLPATTSCATVPMAGAVSVRVQTVIVLCAASGPRATVPTARRVEIARTVPSVRSASAVSVPHREHAPSASAPRVPTARAENVRSGPVPNARRARTAIVRFVASAPMATSVPPAHRAPKVAVRPAAAAKAAATVPIAAG